MATLAQNADGTGVSRNYVAQDHDLEVEVLPKGLEDGVRFIRVFPWRWVTKKSICGGIWQDLNVSWFYDWNISANWTSAPDPNAKQQKAAVAAMMKMLDETPFVERYALYNWVEDARQLVAKDKSLTPAGEVYRDKVSPLAFTQPKGGK
jgi:hypothetical protein